MAGCGRTEMVRWRWRREGRTDSAGGLAVGRRRWTTVDGGRTDWSGSSDWTDKS